MPIDVVPRTIPRRDTTGVCYLVARQHMWMRLGINLLWAAALVGGAAVLVQRGALGVAVAMLIAYVIRVTLTYVYARRLARPLSASVSRAAPD
jgi:hypothetical protein